MTVEELLRSDSIDVVLNLAARGARPGDASGARRRQARVLREAARDDRGEARELGELAESRGLRLGCAPDIFLSGVYQKARSLLDEGAIGEPLAVSAAMLSGGRRRGIPTRTSSSAMLDMGPYYVTAIVSLLGPVRRVAGFASTFVRERTIEIGPRRERFTAETPTHLVDAGARQRRDGHARRDVRVSGHYLDNARARLRRRARPARSEWVRRPDPDQASARRLGTGLVRLPGAADARGLGVHDMVEAIAEERAHRTTAQLATHVVDVARSILEGVRHRLRDRDSVRGRAAGRAVDDVRRAGEGVQL